MSASASGSSGSIIWRGKPWIAPAAIARTIVVIIVAVAAILIEFIPADTTAWWPGLLSFPLIGWTVIAFLLIWALSLLHLLLLWVSHTYILRNDSLEIRTGILTSESFVVAAAGFADMEVDKSIIGRVLNFGDIIIRTQDESGRAKVLKRIRNPLSVGAQIREVMARPIVRIEGQSPTEVRK